MREIVMSGAFRRALLAACAVVPMLAGIAAAQTLTIES